MIRNIALNYERFLREDYALSELFRPASYDWPGDWEGRALLAFLCHYEMHGGELPQLHPLFRALPKKTNAYGYFGKPFDGVTVDEQQLSGHNWYLRGLLKYATLFHSDEALSLAKRTVEHLYLPLTDRYAHYPLQRARDEGDVSGSVTGVQDGWRLSSDVGCAFMCVDGLARYYQGSGDERVRTLLDRAIERFASIDLLKYKLQTHTTLTCLRGILTLYRTTGEKRYLTLVRDTFAFYVAHGMTLTYENFNWFGRENTWTEPCAVVDSLLLATELYRITGEPSYKTLARRIWFNGLQFCQRDNGGAGPNTCVTTTQRVLKISMYEAPFCCTMRYAEGLLAYSQNKELFTRTEDAPVITDELGRRFVDDCLLVQHDGHAVPLFSCNDIPKERAETLALSIL